MNEGRRNYAIVTLAYWADTVADGALRMLVLFHFYQLGFGPMQVASLFLCYELFGVLTNLAGGMLASRFGLKSTLFMGLGAQLLALSMLAFLPASLLTVGWVMASQALSGIAKDLTKMSSKSAVKLVAGEAEGRLYRWVALLTGSKNALKGVGFFVGGWLLSWVGFQAAVGVLMVGVGGALVMAAVPLPAAAYSVKTILQSIQSLLADPNVDSPLNAHAAKLWGVNDAEYRALVQKAYNGPKPAAA